MKKYILTGYFNSVQFGYVSQIIADSNDFDSLQTILENLMSFDIQMDILETETGKIILKTNDYNPPKEYRRAE